MPAGTPKNMSTLLAVTGGREKNLSTHVLEVLFEAQILRLGFPDALERFDQDVAVNEQAKPEHGPHFHPHLPECGETETRQSGLSVRDRHSM